jgi:hypothetical protein
MEREIEIVERSIEAAPKEEANRVKKGSGE